jgi:cell division protein FtsB
MQKTINDLTEEIKQLQAANKKLAEEVKVFKQRYSPESYYHEPKYVVWPSFEEDTESIFKF